MNDPTTEHVEYFGGELADEALDRAEAEGACGVWCGRCGISPAPEAAA